MEARYDERIQARLADSVWTHCSSWYRGPDGRITTNWPLLAVQYRKQTRFNAADYQPAPLRHAGTDSHA